MKPLSALTHYEILNVTPDVDAPTLRRAYRQALGMYREDALPTYSLFSDAERSEAIDAIETAFHTLNDPDRRSAYNRMLAAADRQKDAVEVVALKTAEPLQGDGLASETRTRERSPLEDSAGEVTAPEADVLEDEGVGSEHPGDTERAAPTMASGTALPPAEKAGKATEAPPRAVAEEAARRLADTVIGQEIISGADLKQVREALGVTLDAIFEQTRIPHSMVQMIEADRFDTLPEDVFLKSFLQAYARILRIDPQRVAAGYFNNRASRRPEGE